MEEKDIGCVSAAAHAYILLTEKISEIMTSINRFLAIKIPI